MAVLNISSRAALQGFNAWAMRQARGTGNSPFNCCPPQQNACDRGSPNYIGPDDHIKFSAWSYLNNNDMQIRGRLLRPNGTHSDFERTLRTPTDMSEASMIFRPGEGCLTHITISPSLPNVCHGQAYATAKSFQGSGSTASPLANLSSGYATSVAPLTYPPFKNEHWSEGTGQLFSYTGNNPGVGTEPNIFGNETVSWELHQFQVSLTTDATPGNRQILFHQFDFDGYAMIEALSPYDHPPSTTRNYIFQAGSPESRIGSDIIMVPTACCSTPLCSSHFNICVHGAWGAGDNFGAPQVYVRERLCLCE